MLGQQIVRTQNTSTTTVCHPQCDHNKKEKQTRVNNHTTTTIHTPVVRSNKHLVGVVCSTNKRLNNVLRTYEHMPEHTHTHTHTYSSTSTYIQTDRQTDRQDRQTCMHTHIHTYILPCSRLPHRQKTRSTLPPPTHPPEPPHLVARVVYDVLDVVAVEECLRTGCTTKQLGAGGRSLEVPVTAFAHSQLGLAQPPQQQRGSLYVCAVR